MTGPARDDQAAEGQAPKGQAPESQAPESQAPESQAPESQAPEGQASDAPGPGGQEPGGRSALRCPACGERVWPDDNFCEACRAELAPPVVSTGLAATPGTCPHCPGAAVTPEGYCESCGTKVPSNADHAEVDLGLLAGVTDRGLRHHRNEDAMAVATAHTPAGPAAIAVVCDGVSTSSRPDEAANAAARTAVRVLLAAARAGEDLAAASAAAVRAARQALVGLAAEIADPGGAPSATFVSAVVTPAGVTACWLGDSRAYWLGAPDGTGSLQLTSDDSVAQELVARGLLTASQALASPAGHVVTGWLGADLTDAEPHVAKFAPDGPGVVLLCSDGLWNYQPDAAGLAGRALPAALTDPLAAASALVSFAIEAGGSDNITAVLVPFPLDGAAPPAPHSAEPTTVRRKPR